jgi:hypothetical protein
MKIIIFTGNKGGVGKSFAAALAADYVHRYGKNFIVGDSEAAKGQATFWNIMRHVIPGDTIKSWRLGTDSGFATMLDDLEPLKGEDSTAIIDTGASMLESLAKNLALLVAARDDLDIDIKVVFVAGPLPDSAVAARQYLKEQMNFDNPIKTHFLLLSPTGELQPEYAIASADDIQKGIAKTGGEILFLGTVRQDFFDHIMKEIKLPNEILRDAGTGYGTRKQLALWLSQVLDPVFSKILGN